MGISNDGTAFNFLFINIFFEMFCRELFKKEKVSRGFGVLITFTCVNMIDLSAN